MFCDSDWGVHRKNEKLIWWVRILWERTNDFVAVFHLQRCSFLYHILCSDGDSVDIFKLQSCALQPESAFGLDIWINRALNTRLTLWGRAIWLGELARNVRICGGIFGSFTIQWDYRRLFQKEISSNSKLISNFISHHFSLLLWVCTNNQLSEITYLTDRDVIYEFSLL